MGGSPTRTSKLNNATPNVSGHSPYTVLFGRNWNDGGIPYEMPVVSEPADAFMSKMHHCDQRLAKYWNDTHLLAEKRWNQKFQFLHRKDYQVWDWVWVLRNPNPGKIETWWVGPAKLIQRLGDQSYQVTLSKGSTEEFHDVHWEFLKPYVKYWVSNIDVFL